MNRLKDYIEKLNLQPHPEGGYYRRNWQSSFAADVKDISGKITHPKRALGSSILYFLPSLERCAWHRVSCEEMWHHYSGSPLKIHLVSNQKGWETIILGSDILKGEVPQFVIPPRTWFCAEVINEDSYSFCGCSLWPAFTYADFELAEKSRLIDEFPQYKERIEPWFSA
jgi:predicted cupin superfamily sugar epimerase